MRARVAPKADDIAEFEPLLSAYEPVRIANLAICFNWAASLEQSVQRRDAESVLDLLVPAYGAYRREDNRFTHGAFLAESHGWDYPGAPRRWQSEKVPEMLSRVLRVVRYRLSGRSPLPHALAACAYSRSSSQARCWQPNLRRGTK